VVGKLGELIRHYSHYPQLMELSMQWIFAAHLSSSQMNYRNKVTFIWVDTCDKRLKAKSNCLTCPRLSHKNFTCLNIDSRAETESAKCSMAA